MNTGFIALDNAINGLCPGTLTTIASCPSEGKTACALDIALNVALLQQKPVLFFSLEMPREILLRRIGMRFSPVKSHEEVERMLAQGPMHIDDTPALTPAELMDRVNMHIRKAPGCLVIVDYIQLMGSSIGSDCISETLNSLKQCAQKDGCEVIALFEMTRHTALSRVLSLSDPAFLNHPEVEVLSDNIILIDNERPLSSVTKFILAKNANGQLGEFQITFDEDTVSFKSL